MKRLAFIYNPKAGKGKIENYFIDIMHVFSKEDFEITLVPTKRKNHCCEYIKEEGKRFDIVAVSGGDGTVNEAFNGIMAIEGEKPTLGYIPMGTTNDFALSCEIPTDAFKAAEVVVQGKPTLIDAGLFNGKYFSYVAAFGIFTDVAYDTPQHAKNLLGKAAYIMEGIKRLTNIKSYKMTVEYGDNKIEDEFIFGMVANSKSVGGVNVKGLNVDLSDGLFEVILLKRFSKPMDINAILSDLVNGKEESNYYYVFKTDKLKFLSDEIVAWTLDGEYGGEHTCARVENVPRAIKINLALS